jgi:Phosphotransferase enzyme family
MTGHHEAEQDWTTPDFLRETRTWIDERLAEQGASVSGEIDQPHIVWWSTALRVPTTDGTMWFKAARHTQQFEARLMPLLVSVRPKQMAELVAADTERGWLLTRDAGVRLREYASGRDQLSCWEKLLPEYADLQIELTPRAAELIDIGAADLRIAHLAEAAQAMADDREMLCSAPEDSLGADEYAEFATRGIAELRRLCHELADRGIADTLQHDDLHDGNLFVRDGGFVFFDWGDACVTHPFHTLVVTLRALAYKQGLEPGAPELLRLRDAYLERWTGQASHAELVETAELARRTGTIQRALAWYRLVRLMPPERRHEEQDSVPYGVRLFLQNKPWGAFE